MVHHLGLTFIFSFLAFSFTAISEKRIGSSSLGNWKILAMLSSEREGIAFIEKFPRM